MTRYVALLRGINVGGNKLLKMQDLKAVFESMGFGKIRTVLASGNVLFDAPETESSKLEKKIEGTLSKASGHEVGVLVRKMDEIQALARSEPFKGFGMSEDTKRYVTFLSERPESGLGVPFETKEKNFRVTRVSDAEICWTLQVSPKYGTVDAMAILEKRFGRKITTRNWNTILKILEG